MKKIYFLIVISLGLFTYIQAQELVVGGDMESPDPWTIVDLAAGDGHTETFNYTEDWPFGAEGGCLSLAGQGNWSNVAVCQEITVERGKNYEIAMLVKTSMDFIPESQWVEIVVVPEMPVEDADITAYPNVFALNSWDCSDVLSVDGPFEENNCDNKSPLNNILNLEGEGDTTVVLILKAGGGSPYNVLLDNVSMQEVSIESLESTMNTSLRVFPNPVLNELNISLDQTIQELKVVNVLGQLVYAAENIGSRNVKVDFSDPSPGIYYLIVTDIYGKKESIKAIKK